MRHNPPRGGPGYEAESGGWRSPAKVAENWAACRRMGRWYRLAGLVLLILAGGWLLHVMGYWEGYADGRALRYEESSR